MFVVYSSVLTLTLLHFVNATSEVPISTYTDNQCNVLSTITPNVSIPLDKCVMTVGMQAFHFTPMPCAGGTSTTVKAWGFEDNHCGSQWIYWGSKGGGCYGAFSAGEAFGSIMLTCKGDDTGQPPQTDGTTMTVQVGPVASDTPSSSSSTSSSSSSSSSDNSNSSTGTTTDSGSTSTSGSSALCSGWSCLSFGERLGIIVALAVGIPPIIIALYMLRMKRRKRAEAETNEVALSGWRQQQHHSSRSGDGVSRSTVWPKSARQQQAPPPYNNPYSHLGY